MQIDKSSRILVNGEQCLGTGNISACLSTVAFDRYNMKVADLFCGAGGLSYGFHKLGADFISAHDSWQAAVDSYNSNHGDIAIKTDLSNPINIQGADVLMGGPPCKSFTSAGRRKTGDPRDSLVSSFVDSVLQSKPLIFIFENVEGFITKNNGAWLFELLRLCDDYTVRLRKINFSNYGVPQHRKRVIAIGMLGHDPGFPLATNSTRGAPGAENFGADLPPCPSVASVLSRVPDEVKKSVKATELHMHSLPNGMELKRIKLLKQGGKMKDLPLELQHESFKQRANRRVSDGTPTESRGGAPSGIRRLIGDDPSKAITGSATSEFVHPTENRLITTFECSRIQTFPVDYTFLGKEAEVNELIGNAVPPLFSICLAKHVEYILSKKEHLPPMESGLLEFIPTYSKGKSPILKKVCSIIQSDYIKTDLTGKD